MRKYGWLCAVLFAGAIAGCGSSGGTGGTGSEDSATPTDAADSATPTDTARTDSATPTDTARPDSAADAGASRAGAACTMPDPMGGTDPACGDELVCVDSQSTPFCTQTCENNASQAMERAQCGGTGSTCLTRGDAPNDNSLCTAACRTAGTTAATGACRAGFVCTGWWFTHAGGTPDSTGCFGFCSADSQCATGQRCNTRTGDCGATGVDMTRLPDGSPCNPMMTVTVPGSTTPQNVQCRGICFRTDDDRTHGICGSLLNIRASTMCADDPDAVVPRAPQGTDNLGICIFRNCTTNSDCRSPHVCRFPQDGTDIITDADPFCDYPTAQQRTGIVGDGGAPTDASTPTDASATTDASTGTDGGSAG